MSSFYHVQLVQMERTVFPLVECFDQLNYCCSLHFYLQLVMIFNLDIAACCSHVPVLKEFN